VKVEGRYVMDPSPIPKFDNPKMHRCPRSSFSARGASSASTRMPPYTEVVSLDFEDHPFEPTKADHAARSAARRTAISTR
jgi:alpha-D-ribose 1-methylphosphonate 5-phosphate C-P lyase